MKDLDLSEATAEGGEFDFMGNGWEPIGGNGIYKNTAFTGTFDGNNHTISGMRVNIKNAPAGVGDMFLGLFSSNKGTIKNLLISNSNIGMEYELSSHVAYGGAFCGENYGEIVNCHNKSTNVQVKTEVTSRSSVTGFPTDYYSYSYAGGICGRQ